MDVIAFTIGCAKRSLYYYQYGCWYYLSLSPPSQPAFFYLFIYIIVLMFYLAVDTLGAQKAVLGVATDLGLKITVSVAYEIPPSKTGQFLSSILNLYQF